jgi:hypothetical protein
MKHKTMLLALGALCAAMLTVPSMASAAGEWNLSGAGFPLTFTVASETTTKLVPESGFTVECSGSTGSGQYNNETTGEIELTFTGCHTPFATNNCTTTGKKAGEITTTPNLVFHNVVLEPTPSPVLGTLITPNAGHFATFTCVILGVNNTVVVGGNGIIGQITSPACGTAKVKEGTIVYEQTGGSQKWKQITTTGTSYDLTSSVNGGTPVTAGQEGKGIITLAEAAQFTCP